MPVDDKERGILIPEWRKEEPELTFTEAQRKRKLYARKLPLRVMPFDKGQSVHLHPRAFQTLLRIHSEGIEVGTSMGEGVAKYLGFGGGIICCLAIFFLVHPLLATDIDWFYSFIFCVSISFFLLGVVFIRRAFFSPSDHPTLFNRKTRQVHVIPLKPLNFLKFWEKGKPGKMKTYSWDNVTVR
ncbi:hypothetical protein MA04_04292, partial [Alcanivorax balearicus MACL04]